MRWCQHDRPEAMTSGKLDDRAASDLEVEVAPLDRISADLLQVRIPEGSRLAGVEMVSTRSRLAHAWSLPNFRLLFGDLPIVQENLKLLIVAIIVLSVLPGVIEVIRHKRAASRAAK